jgi:hypothetical protein
VFFLLREWDGIGGWWFRKVGNITGLAFRVAFLGSYFVLFFHAASWFEFIAVIRTERGEIAPRWTGNIQIVCGLFSAGFVGKVSHLLVYNDI